MTTITIGTATVVAAAAGAIGLGIAGIAYHLGRHLGGYGGYGHGYGYGQGYGHGYGYGHDGYGYHRKRRSLENDLSPDDDPVTSADLSSVMEDIRAVDVSGCGAKLVCELAKENEENLTIEELAILSFVGPSIRPGEGLMPQDAHGDYKTAKAYGEVGGDCGYAYPRCRYNATELMDTVMSFLP